MSGWSIVFLGLSITSSWGNGHATTYRGLVEALVRRGHDVLFLERDRPWYAEHRDLPQLRHGRLGLYQDLAGLRADHGEAVRRADVVVVGSFVPDGTAVLRWVLEAARGLVAFYDIDTPVTLARLRAGDEEYLSPELAPKLGLYLSFAGGPVLARLERELGVRLARPLYCAADPRLHRPPRRRRPSVDLGYIGTYSADRQPKLETMMLEPARRWSRGRFVVAGPLYPAELAWPANVARIEHLPPARHGAFYADQRFTLNLTRADMVACGWSPSVRLFEAATCGTPIISDPWPGLGAFFDPGREILVAQTSEHLMHLLRDLTDAESRRIAEAARERVLREHSAGHRAREFERYVGDALSHRHAA